MIRKEAITRRSPHLLRVEGPVLASDALAHDLCVLVDKNRRFRRLLSVLRRKMFFKDPRCAQKITYTGFVSSVVEQGEGGCYTCVLSVRAVLDPLESASAAR